MLSFKKILLGLAVCLTIGAVASFASDDLPKISVNGKEFYCYKVKKGDSLYGLMKRFHWNEDTLMTANSNLNSMLKIGDKIYYPVAKEPGDVAVLPTPQLADTIKTQPILHEPQHEPTPQVQPTTFFYTIKDNDTLYSLALRFDTTVASIKALNNNLDEYSIKAGDVIRIAPNNCISDITSADTAGKSQSSENKSISIETPLDVVVLLPNPSSKRDVDFIRGFLLGVESVSTPFSKLNVRVLNSGNDASGVLADPGVKNASLIVSTYDKNFPDGLAELSTENNIPLINVFDIKTDLYDKNPDFVQILPPTSYFNTSVEKYVVSNFADHIFIFVGNSNSASDPQNLSLQQAVANADITFFTLSGIAELKNFSFDLSEKYVVVSDASVKNKIEQTALFLSNLMTKNQKYDISLLGKPNWIIHTELLKDKYAAANIYIPSRFFSDLTRMREKDFVSRFNQAYGQPPVKSYPMYSLMGMDIASIFIPAARYNRNDMSKWITMSEGVQMNFDLQRANDNGGGLINVASEMLHIQAGKPIEIIELK